MTAGERETVGRVLELEMPTHSYGHGRWEPLAAAGEQRLWH